MQFDVMGMLHRQDIHLLDRCSEMLLEAYGLCGAGTMSCCMVISSNLDKIIHSRLTSNSSVRGQPRSDVLVSPNTRPWDNSATNRLKPYRYV